MNIQQFDYSIDVLESLLWRFNSSVNLQAILKALQDWCDTNHKKFWNDWYRDVFDLRTANDFGLSVWAILLDLPLQIDEKTNDNKPIFGFVSETVDPNGHVNFNNGNFTSLGSGFGLTTKEKRIVLQLRYYQLVSNGNVHDLNKFLVYICKDLDGSMYVLDGLTMYIRLVYSTEISYRLRFIIENYDLIPRGAGVKIEYVVLSEYTFGFGELRQNFYQGNFFGGNVP